MEETKEQMVKRAEAMLDRVIAKREGYTGPCSDCKWQFGRGLRGKCQNPIVQAHALEITDAYARGRIESCDEQRDTNSLYGEVFCGPNGHLFEAKSAQALGFIARLFGNASPD